MKQNTRLKVQVLGLEGTPYETKVEVLPLNNIDPLELPAPTFPEYLFTSLCENYNTYTSSTTVYKDVYNAILSVDIPEFIRSITIPTQHMNKEYLEKCRSLLFHSIVAHLKGNGISGIIDGALYKLLDLTPLIPQAFR